MEDQFTRLANAERIRLSRMSFCDEADESLYWEEYRWRFESTIPRILRYSCITSLLSVIEVSLDRICEKTCEYRKPSTSYKRYYKEKKKKDKQSFLEIALLYLKMINVDGTIPDDAFLPSVNRLKTIPDHIVHANGHMIDGEKRKGLTEAIRTVEGFTVKRECIEVDTGTCERVCRETKRWVDRLMDACGSPYSRA
jgi:hypothetical protein